MTEINDKIRNPKKPSKRDLEVLAFLDAGNRIDSATALGKFKTTGLRDIIYRLRCAGHEIKHEDVVYKAKGGEDKVYRQWFTVDYKIKKTGAKTDKQLHESKEEKKTPVKRDHGYNGHSLFN